METFGLFTGGTGSAAAGTFPAPVDFVAAGKIGASSDSAAGVTLVGGVTALVDAAELVTGIGERFVVCPAGDASTALPSVTGAGAGAAGVGSGAGCFTCGVA